MGSMSEERKKVLEMLDEGKIDVEEADNLLSALEEGGREGKDGPSESEDERGANFLKIHVVENGEEKVDISLPIQLVKALKKFVPARAKEKLGEKGIDLEELVSQIEERTVDGKLVDIDDGKSHVEIKMRK